MKRIARWVAVLVAALVVLIVAALAAVPYLVDTPRIQALIATNAAQALGRPVKFASVHVSTLPLPAVVLKNLEVAEDPAFGQAPFLKIDEAQVRLRFWPLLFFRVELGDFVLNRPVIAVVQNAQGRWNIASLGAAHEGRPGPRPRASGGGAAGAGGLLGPRVKITKGVLSYESRGGGKPMSYRVEDLNLTLSGGGPVSFDGEARVEPGDVAVKITDGTLAMNGAKSLGEAAVRARINLDGKQVRELVASVMGPEPAIAGHVKGALVLSGTVAKARAAGDVELSDLTVSQTRPQCPEPKTRALALEPLKLKLTWEEPRLVGRPVTTGIGKGSISTTLVVTLERRVRVDLDDLAIKGLAAEKILVDFLCQAYAVTGPLALTGNSSASLGDPWRSLNGKGQVHLGPGQVVGAQALRVLGSVVRAEGAVSSLLRGQGPVLSGDSPLEYDAITATYTITNGVLATRDLLFTSKLLKVAAAGAYALASGAMDFDLVVTTAGRDIKAKVTGTATAPSIRVAPESLLKTGERGRIEKGLQDLLKQFK